ncbi:putative uncharacterized protein DDB_G0293878 [Physella acuta]|uniref:putative uncharacterized protein DDB_G0293878 n=1 Tax=Physella acuta TaxID=109671 RepID=UPI0027DC5878|nr:putative uncharacterized protein DDB_G0293878 [Physella acuta]
MPAVTKTPRKIVTRSETAREFKMSMKRDKAKTKHAKRSSFNLETISEANLRKLLKAKERKKLGKNNTSLITISPENVRKHYQLANKTDTFGKFHSKTTSAMLLPGKRAKRAKENAVSIIVATKIGPRSSNFYEDVESHYSPENAGDIQFNDNQLQVVRSHSKSPTKNLSTKIKEVNSNKQYIDSSKSEETNRSRSRSSTQINKSIELWQSKSTPTKTRSRSTGIEVTAKDNQIFSNMNDTAHTDGQNHQELVSGKNSEAKKKDSEIKQNVETTEKNLLKRSSMKDGLGDITSVTGSSKNTESEFTAQSFLKPSIMQPKQFKNNTRSNTKETLHVSPITNETTLKSKLKPKSVSVSIQKSVDTKVNTILPETPTSINGKDLSHGIIRSVISKQKEIDTDIQETGNRTIASRTGKKQKGNKDCDLTINNDTLQRQSSRFGMKNKEEISFPVSILSTNSNQANTIPIIDDQHRQDKNILKKTTDLAQSLTASGLSEQTRETLQHEKIKLSNKIINKKTRLRNKSNNAVMTSNSPNLRKSLSSVQLNETSSQNYAQKSSPEPSTIQLQLNSTDAKKPKEKSSTRKLRHRKSFETQYNKSTVKQQGASLLANKNTIRPQQAIAKSPQSLTNTSTSEFDFMNTESSSRSKRKISVSNNKITVSPLGDGKAKTRRGTSIPVLVVSHSNHTKKIIEDIKKQQPVVSKLSPHTKLKLKASHRNTSATPISSKKPSYDSEHGKRQSLTNTTKARKKKTYQRKIKTNTVRGKSWSEMSNTEHKANFKSPPLKSVSSLDNNELINIRLENKLKSRQSTPAMKRKSPENSKMSEPIPRKRQRMSSRLGQSQSVIQERTIPSSSISKGSDNTSVSPVPERNNRTIVTIHNSSSRNSSNHKIPSILMARSKEDEPTLEKKKKTRAESKISKSRYLTINFNKTSNRKPNTNSVKNAKVRKNKILNSNFNKNSSNASSSDILDRAKQLKNDSQISIENIDSKKRSVTKEEKMNALGLFAITVYDTRTGELITNGIRRETDYFESGVKDLGESTKTPTRNTINNEVFTKDPDVHNIPEISVEVNKTPYTNKAKKTPREKKKLNTVVDVDIKGKQYQNILSVKRATGKFLKKSKKSHLTSSKMQHVSVDNTHQKEIFQVEEDYPVSTVKAPQKTPSKKVLSARPSTRKTLPRNTKSATHLPQLMSKSQVRLNTANRERPTSSVKKNPSTPLNDRTIQNYKDQKCSKFHKKITLPRRKQVSSRNVSSSPVTSRSRSERYQILKIKNKQNSPTTPATVPVIKTRGIVQFLKTPSPDILANEATDLGNKMIKRNLSKSFEQLSLSVTSHISPHVTKNTNNTKENTNNISQSNTRKTVQNKKNKQKSFSVLNSKKINRKSKRLLPLSLKNEQRRSLVLETPIKKHTNNEKSATTPKEKSITVKNRKASNIVSKKAKSKHVINKASMRFKRDKKFVGNNENTTKARIIHSRSALKSKPAASIKKSEIQESRQKRSNLVNNDDINSASNVLTQGSNKYIHSIDTQDNLTQRKNTPTNSSKLPFKKHQTSMRSNITEDIVSMQNIARAKNSTTEVNSNNAWSPEDTKNTNRSISSTKVQSINRWTPVTLQVDENKRKNSEMQQNRTDLLEDVQTSSGLNKDKNELSQNVSSLKVFKQTLSRNDGIRKPILKPWILYGAHTMNTKFYQHEKIKYLPIRIDEQNDEYDHQTKATNVLLSSRLNKFKINSSLSSRYNNLEDIDVGVSHKYGRRMLRKLNRNDILSNTRSKPVSSEMLSKSLPLFVEDSESTDSYKDQKFNYSSDDIIFLKSQENSSQTLCAIL